MSYHPSTVHFKEKEVLGLYNNSLIPNEQQYAYLRQLNQF